MTRTRSITEKLIAVILLISLILPYGIIIAGAANESEAQYKASLAAQGFPESYHDQLWQMHLKYPNWNFKPLMTGIDWNIAVANESLNAKCTAPIQNTTRSLLSKSWGTYNADGSFTYKVIDGDQAAQRGHVNTTPLAVSYFMDPRNFLSEVKTIFQFEELAYDSSVHTLAAVEKVVASSFMNNKISYTNTSGVVVNTDKRYAQAILEAGITYNVNPCYLAGKIIQEVGNNGSGSVSGTVEGYVGYYNFYNIGAYESSSGQAVINGLKRAKAEGWDSPEKAIKGGAAFIANSYIAKGQSTAYLQKFNVNPNGHYPVYTHQYMSAVNDPAQAAASTYSGYVNLGTLESTHSFLIPVFNNMPDRTADKITLNDATRQGFCNEDGVNVRRSPGIDSSLNPTTGYKIYRNTNIEILGGYRTANMYPIYKHQLYYPFWYNIRFTASDGTVQTGYVHEDFIDTGANISMSIGTSRTLGYTLFPSESREKPMFMSMDTRIATVDQNGKVTAVAPGTTNIIAYVSKGAFDVLPVKVVEESVDVPPAITSPIYPISSGYINVLSENLSIGGFKNGINEKQFIKIYNASGVDITNARGNISTGYVVKLMNGASVIQILTVAVRGDVSGDGSVNITDLLGVKSHILNRKSLSGAYAVAGNMDNDPRVIINVTDFLQIKKYLLSK